MEQIKITTRMFLVEGGCNACGMLNTCTYTLHFSDGQEATIEELDGGKLAVAVALKNGYRQQVEPIGIGEDAIYLVKGTNKIQVAEDDFKTKFTTDTQNFIVEKKECTLAEVYERANHLLKDFFQLTPVTFQLEE